MTAKPKDGGDFMTNREMIRGMYNMISDMKGDVSVLKTVQGIEKERMDKHEKAIDNLRLWRNINAGGIISALAAAIGIK